ncbi:MAG: class I SAM-dependent methyltransferase [Cyanobacteria bacterium SBLK]|nr:class I SAM-dependent methyltransferase [Cyanobacteria bacterium SBLK]
MYDISSGEKQPPSIVPTGELSYLLEHDGLLGYHDLFQRNLGTFYKHFTASIPFAIEEQCRIGLGICRLARNLIKDENNYLTFCEMGVGDGPNGRTMAEFSKGKIRTLSTSNSVHSKNNFHQLCNHNYSKFHHGSFIEITPEYITSHTDLGFFRNGFNVIYENAAFQFYGSEREDIIDYVARLLQENGLMIFLEKLKHSDELEYRQREKIKDDLFKKKFFSDCDIAEKRLDILEVMEYGQVDIESLIYAIKQNFKYVYLVWNSTNFYEFVASNNERMVSEFLNLLPPPYLPSPFCVENNLPKCF